MTRAARSLNATQPSISVAVKNLEEELGTTLLNRDSRGVSLTAAGRTLRDTAQEIFELIDRARAEISDLQSEVVGQFTIGCNEALGAYFLPAFLRRFMVEAPRVQVSVWNDRSAEVREAVIDRRVDFGLVVNPQPHPDLVMRKLFRDAIEVFVSVEEPRPSTLADALARVKRGPLIAARRIPAVQDLIARFDGEDSLPECILDSGDLHLVQSLATAGLGVALLPRRVALMRPGELVQLHPDLPRYPDVISLLYRADLHRTQGSMTLKQALIESGERLRDDVVGGER